MPTPDQKRLVTKRLADWPAWPSSLVLRQVNDLQAFAWRRDDLKRLVLVLFSHPLAWDPDETGR